MTSQPTIKGMLDRATMRPATVYTPPEDLIPDPNYDPRPLRRTARYAIDARELAYFLDLPDGCSVVAVETTNDPVSVVMVLRSDDFPQVPHNAQSPYAQRTVEVERVGDRVVRRTVELSVAGDVFISTRGASDD